MTTEDRFLRLIAQLMDESRTEEERDVEELRSTLTLALSKMPLNTQATAVNSLNIRIRELSIDRYGTWRGKEEAPLDCQRDALIEAFDEWGFNKQ